MKESLKIAFRYFRDAVRRHRRIAAAVVITVCLIPTTGKAAGLSDIISLLNTITSTIQDAIGGALSAIQNTESVLNRYRQETLWPLAAINQTKNFVTSTIGRYRTLMWQIEGLKNSSATLANPSQLEQAFRSAQAANVSQIGALYTSVYNAVPQPANAKPVQRNMMDMDDALAMESLKSAVLSDQTTQNLLTVADSMEQQSSTQAPGSGPMVAAEAQVASLETQAYLAKVLAAELRQEAAKLAHQNTLLKQSAASTRNLQNQAQQILSHP